MRCMYQYSENNQVLSRHLKLSVLSVESRISSLSEFPAVGLATANTSGVATSAGVQLRVNKKKKDQCCSMGPWDSGRTLLLHSLFRSFYQCQQWSCYIHSTQHVSSQWMAASQPENRPSVDEMSMFSSVMTGSGCWRIVGAESRSSSEESSKLPRFSSSLSTSSSAIRSTPAGSLLHHAPRSASRTTIHIMDHDSCHHAPQSTYLT